MAIDFEGWELNHSVLTELGWSYTQWREGFEFSDKGHLIVKEHMTYRNGKYVDDQRDVSSLHAHAFFDQR